MIKSDHLPSADTHNEPSKLAKHKDIKRKLFAGEDINEDVYSVESATFPGEEEQRGDRSETKVIRNITRNPLELLSDAIQHTESNELIEVLGPFGRITFRAMHVSINSYGVAFIVNKDHMTYEPKINTNLILKWKDYEYKVVYAGGYFTFKQMPFTFLSFIKITEDEE